MAKKLYLVVTSYYVVAEDEEEARSIRIFDNEAVTMNVIEATFVNQEWWDAIPFNGDDDRTCGEILKVKKG